MAIAENPLRMVVYSAKTTKWKDLHFFDVVWGYWDMGDGQQIHSCTG